MSAPARFERLDSLDVFRGLTMFLMLFANDLNDPDLGHIAHVPDWLRHMPGGQDGMTFVDVIFPAFLFGAGLSIPLALGRRLGAADQAGALRHVALRSLWLVVIGLGMVNTYRFHPTAMPISPAWWEFLFFLAVIIVWQSPAVRNGQKSAKSWWKVVGVAALVALAVVYRGDSDGTATWMRTSWWGILTMIGFAYFVTAMTFVLWRGALVPLVTLLALTSALNIAGLTGAMPPIGGLFPAGTLLGGLPSITAAGAIAGVLMTADHRIGRLLGFAGLLAAAGLLLYAPWGLSKHACSPAWCLLSTAICCALYTGIHWLVDVRGWSRWGVPLLPAGRQPLLAYMLPHLFYSLLGMLGVTWLDDHLNTGWPGIARSLILAALLVALTHILTLRRVVVRL